MDKACEGKPKGDHVVFCRALFSVVRRQCASVLFFMGADAVT